MDRIVSIKGGTQAVQKRFPDRLLAQCSKQEQITLNALNRRQLLASSTLPLLLFPSAPAASAESIASKLNRTLTEFTLANGLRFLVCQRNAAPVVSCHVIADVGAYDEIDSQTGIAHTLEHMAFKGTQRIGTRNFAEESQILDALDEAFYDLRDAKDSFIETKGAVGNAAVRRAEQRFKQLQDRAAMLEVPNAFGSLLNRQGAVGLNATTSHDSTKYYISLPSNKLELWFALESERFKIPVFRSLYSEKAVITEERKLRVDNSPLGPFQEAFSQASLTNNYRRPVIGYQEDIDRVGRREVDAFFREHYGPSSLTIAIVGDCTPSQVRKYAEKYFGDWHVDVLPTASCDGLVNDEPLPKPTTGLPLELVQKSKAGPAIMHAYYRPCVRHPSSLALDIASDLLTGSRSSRLTESLVLPGIAINATSFASYPAEKHPSQFVLYATPAPGRSLKDIDTAFSDALASLASGGPSQAEIARYKKAAKVQMLSALTSNSALASALCSYQVLEGDWRNIGKDVERIEAMTSAHIREAVQTYLISENKFTGVILPL